MTSRLTAALALAAVSLTSAVSPTSSVQGADWLRFRGPNGSGVSADAAPVPAQWSPTENLKWKTPLPGSGVSSPIVVGDRVFVTCYSGYGVDRRDSGQLEDLQRHLVCVDRASGKILWDKSVKAVQPEDAYSGMGVPSHGYASHTPVSDGERVYVFFGKSGALAFDFDGNQLWQTSAGTGSDQRRWGSSSSPVLFGSTLIVTASAESESVVGLDTKTGEQLWKQQAAGLANVWGTPLLVSREGGETDLVLGVPYEIWGLNPENGKLRWYAEAPAGDQFNSSVVESAGVVYAVEGRSGGSIAVTAGGKGDISKSNVVWTGRDSSRFGTPLVHDGRLYYFSGSVASCVDAKTGDRLYQSRLSGGDDRGGPAPGGPDRGGFGGGFGGGRGGGGSDYSSPVLADGKIFYTRGSGDVYVIKAGPGFEQLAVNRVTTDTETFSATPAISEGQLFIRSTGHLYCIAGKE